MSTNRKKLVALLMLFGVTVVLAGYAALAEEGFAPLMRPDYKFMEPFAPETNDGTAVYTIGYSRLSDHQFGDGQGWDLRTEFHPGEFVWGTYDWTVTGAPATNTLDSYEIPLYNQSLSYYGGTFAVGSQLSSWGFEIPDSLAVNGERPVFRFTLTADNAATVFKDLDFTVIRKAVLNCTRAFQDDCSPLERIKILKNMSTVRGYMRDSDLKYDPTQFMNSANAGAFIGHLQDVRPNATLIHSHGNSDDGGRIFLQDYSYVNAAAVLAAFTGENAKFKPPAGLFYAAACETAKAKTLGAALVSAGYRAFIGYQVTVLTSRNADFYQHFYQEATKPKVPIDDALEYTKAWAVTKNPPWDDVATAKIIGDNAYAVYLGGDLPTTTSSPGDTKIKAATPRGKKIKAVTPPFVGWTDISAMKPGYYEMKAVQAAEEAPEVQHLQRAHRANLATGIENLATVHRVAYKDKAKGIFLYGVDVDKTTGKIVDQGELD